MLNIPLPSPTFIYTMWICVAVLTVLLVLVSIWNDLDP